MLAGVDAPPRSREHSLVAALLTHAWQRGASLDLASLIREVQSPPFDKVGVVDLESFFPAKERFALAMQLNGVLAAPGFEVWLEGEPLDPQTLFYDADGPAARVGLLDCPSRRRRAHVLRVAADEPDGRLDAPPERHDQPARHPLHGRDPRLLSAGRQPAVEGAAAHAAQAGAGVRPRASCSPRRTPWISTTRAWRIPAPGFSAGCRPNGTRPACSTGSKARAGGLDRARGRSPPLGVEEAHLPDAQRARRRARRCSRPAGRCRTCAGRSRGTRSRR